MISMEMVDILARAQRRLEAFRDIALKRKQFALAKEMDEEAVVINVAIKELSK